MLKDEKENKNEEKQNKNKERINKYLAYDGMYKQRTHTHTHIHSYRVSRRECARLRENVP